MEEKKINKKVLNARIEIEKLYSGVYTDPIVLISCAKKQNCGTHPAKDLYNSTLFKCSLKAAYKITKPNKIFILSTKNGLVHLTQKIKDYNEKDPKKFWGSWVNWGTKIVSQLQQHGFNLANENIISLASKKYNDAINAALVTSGYNVLLIEPLKGLRQGERMAALG